MKLEDVRSRLLAHRRELKRLGAERLSLFGSVARGEAGPESDVDIVVDSEGGEALGLFRLARLTDELERILGRPVDVISRRGLEHTDVLKRRVAADLVDVF